ncbi:programmed cell death 6-interacting protein [Colias croceus]|uniref:programmed cell death 6-interacting protein n=1 Tax=Colias crocea TaxID=72248 RepID=UPI001E27C127|nr:programmed cell death 6-interacting protein [Colias croceus]
MAELLAVPFKKSSDVDIVKPLKNLIQNTYSQSTEDFSDAINELSRLRTAAIWKVFEKSTLDDLYSYYDQLVSLESKIPPQEVQIPFKWKDAFDKGSIFGGRMSLTISYLAYERMCILFNIAAMQSAIAAQQPLDTEESLKLAAKLLQQSAGIFAYLKGNIMLAVHQETTPDLNPDTLNALSQLMLAQAQEVIAYKCIRDEMKDSMVAKVCAQCEELFTDALRSMQKDALKNLWERDWLSTISAKQATFRGLTQYHQAQVCRANKSVGEEIARLQLAGELLRAAPGGAGGGRVGELAARAGRQLAAAARDNDFIYHERVPEAAALEPVPRAPVAKPLPPQPRWGAAPDLWEALLPAVVHAALAASDARRAELVGAEINKLRDATQLLNSIMASLNLPACIESPSGGGLPESIRSKARAVREAGGLAALQQLMADLPDLLQRNRDILNEAERMLREEEQADAALRTQFGARWARTASPQLTEAFRANSAKYAQIIDNAVRADAIVQQKFQQHKESIELLSRSEGEIDADVPDAPAPRGADGDALRALRALVADVEALKAQRDELEAALKDATLDLRERFLAALAADGALDEPALSAAALGAALAPLQRRAAASLAAQERLAAELQAAHARLMATRGGASGRDAALGKLCAAHDAYQDLTGNLQEGVKFYNDLTQLLVAFQNKVSDFCFARKTEKEELLKDLTQEASRGTARPAPSPPQHHVDAANEPAVVKKEAPPRPPPPSAGSAPAATSSALPYPAQPQGMPLPYGAAPYAVYAPVPAMYNPYATLPYPHHVRPQQPYQPYQYPPPPAGYPQPPPAGYNPYPPAPQ